jgi:hypothetical protein
MVAPAGMASLPVGWSRTAKRATGPSGAAAMGSGAARVTKAIKAAMESQSFKLRINIYFVNQQINKINTSGNQLLIFEMY